MHHLSELGLQVFVLPIAGHFSISTPWRSINSLNKIPLQRRLNVEPEISDLSYLFIKVPPDELTTITYPLFFLPPFVYGILLLGDGGDSGVFGQALDEAGAFSFLRVPFCLLPNRLH